MPNFLVSSFKNKECDTESKASEISNMNKSTHSSSDNSLCIKLSVYKRLEVVEQLGRKPN